MNSCQLMSYMSLYAILSLSDIPPPWETKYTLVMHHQYTCMVHSGLTMFAMTDQNAVYLAIATIPPSVIGIWYLSLPKVNLTV